MWKQKEFIDEDWEDRVFEEAEWEGCRFVRCNFREAVLKEWVTRSSVFEACDFTGAKLNASHHEGTAFLNCRTDLYVSRFASCKMTGSGFEGARMEGMTILRRGLVSHPAGLSGSQWISTGRQPFSGGGSVPM